MNFKEAKTTVLLTNQDLKVDTRKEITATLIQPEIEAVEDLAAVMTSVNAMEANSKDTEVKVTTETKKTTEANKGSDNKFIEINETTTHLIFHPVKTTTTVTTTTIAKGLLVGYKAEEFHLN
jgi:hypothetical protein